MKEGTKENYCSAGGERTGERILLSTEVYRQRDGVRFQLITVLGSLWAADRDGNCEFPAGGSLHHPHPRGVKKEIPVPTQRFYPRRRPRPREIEGSKLGLELNLEVVQAAGAVDPHPPLVAATPQS